MATFSSPPAAVSVSERKCRNITKGSHGRREACEKEHGEESMKLGYCRKGEVTDAQQVPSWSHGNKPQYELSVDNEYDYGVVPDYNSERETKDAIPRRIGRRGLRDSETDKRHASVCQPKPSNEDEREGGVCKRAKTMAEMQLRPSWWPTCSEEWDHLDAKARAMTSSEVSAEHYVDGSISSGLFAANQVRNTIIAQQNTFREQVQALHRVVERQEAFCRDLRYQNDRTDMKTSSRHPVTEPSGYQHTAENLLPHFHQPVSQHREFETTQNGYSAKFSQPEAKDENLFAHGTVPNNNVGGVQLYQGPSYYLPSHYQQSGESNIPQAPPWQPPMMAGDWPGFSVSQWMPSNPLLPSNPQGGGLWFPPGMHSHPMAAMASFYSQQLAACSSPWTQQAPPSILGQGVMGNTIYSQHHPSHFQQWWPASSENAVLPRPSDSGEWAMDRNSSMHNSSMHNGTMPNGSMQNSSMENNAMNNNSVHSNWPRTAQTSPVRPPFKRPPPMVLVRDKDKFELKSVPEDKCDVTKVGDRRQGSAGSSCVDEPMKSKPNKISISQDRLDRPGSGHKATSGSFREANTEGVPPEKETRSGGSGEGEGDVIDSREGSNVISSTANNPSETKGSSPSSMGEGETLCQRPAENRDWLVEDTSRSAKEGDIEDGKTGVDSPIPYRPRPRRLELGSCLQKDDKGKGGKDGEKMQWCLRPRGEGQIATWQHASSSAFEANGLDKSVS